MSTMMVTGHRPNKLKGGYNCLSPENLKLRKVMYDAIVASNCTHFISGGALGVDQMFALEVIRYKKEHPDKGITLEIAVPCRNHSSKWVKESVELYNFVLSRADKTTLVTDKPYSPYLMQVRNEYMVNHSDEILAIWDGTSGGTGNCVQYAQSKGIKLTIINPNELVNSTPTRVVHCKKEAYDVYIGRPSKWGNPFSHKSGTQAKFKVATVTEAVEAYRTWILTQPQLLADLHELKGKVLGCWCKPGPCHGDVLAELADKL